MKHSTILISVVAASLILGTSAWAQGRGHEDRQDERLRNSQGQHRGQEPMRDHGNPHDNRGNGPRGYDQDRRGPGAGPNHNFYRGERLSYEYRHNSYVVEDWRDHHLSAPPRGYHWVQTGSDYVLIAIATGIIAQILLGGY